MITRPEQLRHPNEAGSSVLELALVAPLLIFMLVAAIDFGRGYTVLLTLSSAAEAGSLYGIQNPADTHGMAAAAALDAVTIPAMSTTITYGCECSDGSSAVPACTAAPTCAHNVVNFVDTQTTASYTPLIPYPGIPSLLLLKGHNRMRAAH